MLAEEQGSYLLLVKQDDITICPRELDAPFGKMVCFHSRHSLGDKHDYERPSDFRKELYIKAVGGGDQGEEKYAYDGGLHLKLATIPQKALAHNYMTATATIDGNKVNMRPDADPENAQAPLTIVNTKGFTLPKTGDNGTMMFTVAGAAGVIVVACRKKKEI